MKLTHTLTRWHYTKGLHLRSLLSEGRIRLAPGYGPWERAAVWTSVRQTWEPTIAPTVVLMQDGREIERRWIRTIDEAAEIVQGLVRIAVPKDLVPYSWSQFRTMSGIKSQHAEALEITARRQGADARDWFVGFVPIPKDAWLRIEGWNPTTREWQQVQQEAGV